MDHQREHDLTRAGPRLILAKLEEPSVRADLESIDIATRSASCPLRHVARTSVREWAGDGPLVSDDRTRLDFTVPKSIDSSFGFTNPNTGDWLTELMDRRT